MAYRTAAEWKERGYLIRTGERSYTRNRWGTATFGRDQVRPIEPVVVHHYHHYYY